MNNIIDDINEIRCLNYESLISSSPDHFVNCFKKLGCYKPFSSDLHYNNTLMRLESIPGDKLNFEEVHDIISCYVQNNCDDLVDAVKTIPSDEQEIFNLLKYLIEMVIFDAFEKNVH